MVETRGFNLSFALVEEDEVKLEEAVLKEEAVLTVPSELRHSEEFGRVMSAIDNYEGKHKVDSKAIFDVISSANRLAAEVDVHQERVCKYVQELYSERFPELEGLVPDKMEYLKTVFAIQNESDITKVALDKVLPGHTSMIVRI
jgi:RNA processing factor Prp31